MVPSTRNTSICAEGVADPVPIIAREAAKQSKRKEMRITFNMTWA
jgi:hypothetical protein